MRILVLSLGTRGDFEILATLAREMAKRGHEVTVATSAFFIPNTVEPRLRWKAIGSGSKEDLLAVLHDLSHLADKTKRIQLYATRWLRKQLATIQDDLGPLTAHTDYFISSLKLVLRRGTRVMPSAAITYDLPPDLSELDKSPTATLRRDGSILEIVAMNKSLIDPDNCWDPAYRFSGFWAARGAASNEPAPELIKFLQQPPLPILLTFGSMVLADPEQLLETLAEALRLTGQRAIVVRGWSELTVPETDTICCINEAPYEWLIPQCSCVIHHGGCGTVSAVLRSGVPSIVLPQIASQESFGRLLVDRRLATAMLESAGLSAMDLARAIDTAVRDQETHNAVNHWQSIVSRDAGVTTAAEWIEQHWEELRSRV